MKRTLQVAGVLALVGGLSFAAVQATKAATRPGVSAKLAMMGFGAKQQPAATGTVSAISGNSITLASSNGTTYTVDASNAQLVIMKPVGTSLQNSGIQTGDTLNVFGTVSGTNIAATRIMDGKFAGGFAGRMRPAATGTVSAISGNSITLASSNGTTYTVDASNAEVLKVANNSKTKIQVSGIQNGETLTVFGTVSGSNIAATRIVDGTLPAGHGFGKMMHM